MWYDFPEPILLLKGNPISFNYRLTQAENGKQFICDHWNPMRWMYLFHFHLLLYNINIKICRCIYMEILSNCPFRSNFIAASVNTPTEQHIHFITWVIMMTLMAIKTIENISNLTTFFVRRAVLDIEITEVAMWCFCWWSLLALENRQREPNLLIRLVKILSIVSFQFCSEYSSRYT